MGLLNQIIRSLKESLRNFRKKVSGNKSMRSRKARKDEPTVLHKSWDKTKQGKPGEKTQFVYGYQKKRIPGFRQIKRLVAAGLLLINFILSQFLLGSLGQQGQPLFVLFLLNSFILADYLWKTRRKPE